ncbi:MAG: class I SAM-dependent methyltransferase [Candidatus Moraniibacteriota bacterium]
MRQELRLTDLKYDNDQQKIEKKLTAVDILEQFEAANDKKKADLIQSVLVNNKLDKNEIEKRAYKIFCEKAERYLLQAVQKNQPFIEDVFTGPNAIAEYHQENVNYIFQMLSKIGFRKAINFVLSFIQTDGEALLMFDIIQILKNDSEYSLERILSILDKNNFNEWQFSGLIIMATDLVGVETVRNKLNKLIYENKQNGDKKKVDDFEYARSFITPNNNKEAIYNLQEFYQTKIKFEDYKINERMNEKEVILLQEVIDKNKKVLEMGCGTGRLIIELAKSGYDVSGYDYTERHAQITKEKLAENKIEAKVFQGDWYDNALADESFDAIYSLGRNILHDYSIISQAQFFREAARILKRGGKFIFDIPNRERGGYKELVEEYVYEMKKYGIKNFRYGAIYDSPDGTNFATRYAYSSEDISQLAQISGFEIEEVRKEKLETGKDDENLYYVLRKKD